MTNIRAGSGVLVTVFVGINDYVKPKKDKKIVEEEEQSSKSRSRSHKKHTRQKSEESWSPSSKRDRKKRKRSRGSSHRRKKHRSRSRSRSRGRSKSHRSYHKKKQSKRSGSSHRDKEKSRKKKHKRHRTPSSVSTLPSSESTSPSSPTTLPSESESDMEVQVIESDEKKSSRSSSVVSLPSVCGFSKNADIKKKSSDISVQREEKDSPKVEGYTSAGDENSVSSTLSTQTLLQKSRPLFPALESSNSSEGATEVDKRTHFNPNTSSAMAKIAQGLRAKLNALLEKENKME
ncbi:hypothetical protein Anas_09446 [Armadillidium nasatum]|uniref:Uncharacterized protein n=1 Tax=Armadillidium nasatum TaxID=96803 RepID=A0A5N5SQS3_9CRUS|nr:hypothetical protein Anas_09446 [Armadillidium nasatum]